MSGPGEMLTKREFLEMTGLILKEILNPQMLRSALETAAVKLNIPDSNALVAAMLAVDNGASGRGRETTDKKEKTKRSLTPYNMYVSYFSDFAAHYGRHPTIAKVKAENPTVKLGMGFCSEFYKTLSQEQKDCVMDTFKTFLAEHGAKGEADAAGSILSAFKKYEAIHPAANIAKIMGLEARDDYKTDPAQMRLEAAEARRLADGGGAGAPTPTPFGTVTKLDFGNGHHRSELEAGPTPGAELKSEVKERNKDKSEKKAKRKAEQLDAAAAPDGGAVGLQLDGTTVSKKQKLDEEGTEAKSKKEKKDKGEKKDKAETAPATTGKDSVKSEKKKKDKGDKSEQKHKDKGKEEKHKEKKSEKKHKDKHVQQVLPLNEEKLDVQVCKQARTFKDDVASGMASTDENTYYST
ncbi:hypothetical protein VOLCADRAFT_107416 [Volvox carteri f. nagariensis]|uniref:Uncharacterized protein n=1 Tax=Volvox carteri f. nagariensis TaxID=3068 RepID=D8UDW3_VOLCA|nr:uncharacterized protein VOLCADRAFT_107416 [Volvox carteri f. nagariensis]EFJ42116.1 hypothetical protein VOLCADRAFT_107416 [Volvox carteri f. nagariensis]|eukprot:XP_002956813.1 hypothetical protein VOLCADRAFT_107416 [Volvox carteri f. nagariensis]